jgi:hypothetical protein
MQGTQSTVLCIYVAMICQTQNDPWTRSLSIPCALCIVQGWFLHYYFLLFQSTFPTDVSEILAV